MNQPRKKTDIFSKRKRSEIMGSIKGRGTAFENEFAKLLFMAGLEFRRNQKNLPGKPDIVIRKVKAVVFLDSCFWHGCKRHFKPPRTNVVFWKKKIKANVIRDERVTKGYKLTGWKIFRFWGHDVKTNPDRLVKKIIEYAEKQKAGEAKK